MGIRLPSARYPPPIGAPSAHHPQTARSDTRDRPKLCTAGVRNAAPTTGSCSVEVRFQGHGYPSPRRVALYTAADEQFRRLQRQGPGDIFVSRPARSARSSWVGPFSSDRLYRWGGRGRASVQLRVFEKRCIHRNGTRLRETVSGPRTATPCGKSAQETGVGRSARDGRRLTTMEHLAITRLTPRWTFLPFLLLCRCQEPMRREPAARARRRRREERNGLGRVRGTKLPF